MTKRKIEGIYNYCDRWCERCTFTSRCTVYEDETDLNPEERDISNKAFWERIGQNFLKAQKILQKAAAHQGIDVIRAFEVNSRAALAGSEPSGLAVTSAFAWRA